MALDIGPTTAVVRVRESELTAETFVEVGNKFVEMLGANSKVAVVRHEYHGDFREPGSPTTYIFTGTSQ